MRKKLMAVSQISTRIALRARETILFDPKANAWYVFIKDRLLCPLSMEVSTRKCAKPASKQKPLSLKDSVLNANLRDFNE